MAATAGAGKGVSAGTGVTAGKVGVGGSAVPVGGSTAVAGTVVADGSGVAGEATTVSGGGEEAPGASVGVPSEQATATATRSRDARMTSGPFTIRDKTARRLIFNIFSFSFKHRGRNLQQMHCQFNCSAMPYSNPSRESLGDSS